MAISKEDIKQAIKSMTVLELSELVKELEEEFGVTAAAPVAVAAAAAPADGAARAEEKTEYKVTLKAFGESKVPVIKVVRELTGLGLQEAKALVDGVPSVLKEGVTKEQAEDMKAKLEAAGAVVVVE